MTLRRLTTFDCCHIYTCASFFATDNGGDQNGADTLMDAETRPMPLVIYLRQWCIRHQNQLCSGKQLKRLLQGLVWRTAAKAINTWRASSGPKKMFDAYAALTTIDAAKATVKSVPQRPMKGRWGYTWHTAQYMLRAGYRLLPAAFAVAFDTNMPPPAAAHHDPLFDLNPDEEGYSNQQRRYAQQAYDEMCKPDFWCACAIFVITGGIGQHLDNWLMQKHGEGERHMMLRFVTECEPTLYNDYGELITNNHNWFELVTILDDMVPAERQSQWVAEAASHTLERANNHYLRFSRRTNHFPCKMLWLVYRDCNVICEKRKT